MLITYCSAFCCCLLDGSEPLCVQATLVSLDLSYNLLSATGAAAIAKGVSKSSTLRRLMLRHNDIRSAGAAQVMLRSSQCLAYPVLFAVGNSTCWRCSDVDSFAA